VGDRWGVGDLAGWCAFGYGGDWTVDGGEFLELSTVPYISRRGFSRPWGRMQWLDPGEC